MPADRVHGRPAGPAGPSGPRAEVLARLMLREDTPAGVREMIPAEFNRFMAIQ